MTQQQLWMILRAGAYVGYLQHEACRGGVEGSQHLSRDGEAKRPNTENDPNEPQGAEG